MEKDSGNRYQSAKELAVDLRRLAPSTVTSAMAAAPRRCSRRQMALVAGIVLAIAATALALANPGEWRTRLFAGPSPPVRTIAVLPLLEPYGRCDARLLCGWNDRGADHGS